MGSSLLGLNSPFLSFQVLKFQQATLYTTLRLLPAAELLAFLAFLQLLT